jgi:hypothetical protein
MAGHKRDAGLNERLDRLSLEVVRASASNEDAAEAVASSPFLYTRLRARIGAERERLEEGEGWLSLLSVIWRAAPAMATVTIFAFALFWSSSMSNGSAGNLSVESLLGTRDAGIEQIVFAEGQPLSSDEVLATILDEEEQGGAK